jgi:SARP family transcriptional regulator, regulator of embCAB operon
MEIGLLGTVEARHNGQPIRLGRRQERCLLGVLLLEPDRAIGTDRLVDLLWGDHPPTRARATVHTYVNRLRSRLAPYGVQVATRGAGYAVTPGPAIVDVHRFLGELGQARRLGSPAARARTLRAALDLWRGPLLADVADEPLRARLSVRLDEQRIAAMEMYAQAQLELGHHATALPEVAAWVNQQPTRERLVSLLMTVLHQSGRRAEALQLYRRTRAALVTEHGIEPGTELQQLHRRILAEAPTTLEEAITLCRQVENQIDLWHARNMRTGTLRLLGRARAGLAEARSALALIDQVRPVGR